MDRKPVPWLFVDSPLLKAWTWSTEHFEAKIFSMGTQNGYAWKVVDSSGSRAVTLGAGEAQRFNQAEDELLELIGKSYPITLGYQSYAGDLATTFVLRSGRKVDLAPYVGTDVIVDVFNKEDPSTPITLVGVFSIKNYKVHIRTDRSSVSAVPPEFIINIRREFDPTKMQDKVERQGSRRVFQQEWVKGCTGRPGFLVGTVIHNPTDEFCPIHDS